MSIGMFYRKRAQDGAGGEPDRGAAMVTTLIAIMLTATLSVLMLGVVVAQLLPTSLLQANSQTIFAAEAGVHAELGQIRTAEAAPDYTAAIYGDPDRLPCTASGPVDGATDELRYSATVQYFLDDPTGRSAAWVASHALLCTPGSGPVSDPAYALITSRGEGVPVAGKGTDASDRTVSAVYEFQVTNSNIPGGLIYSMDANPDQTEQYCLQAESATVGARIRYIPAVDCGSNDFLQLWIYDTTYQLKLASSTIPTLADDPLCITATPSGSSPVLATLQVCKAPTDAARWNQLYSWEGGSKWRGQRNPVGAGYSDYWLSSGATGDPNGRYLHIWSTSASDNEWGSFDPDPRVGAGAASYETHQIVNYLEFGRCFDVTNEQVGSAFMIVYPCKQDPKPGSNDLKWNHKWYYTEPADKVGSRGPQQIYVLQNDDPGRKYCLVSPGTEGGYVVLTPSCSGSALNQRWTRHANTGSYGTSYTFTDNWGRCISLGDAYNGWTKMTTATCNGGLGQKWNAPPNTVSASLGGYQELH